MRKVIIYISIILFFISCNAVSEEETVVIQPRILIGKVKTTTSEAHFFEVTNPLISKKYYDLFVDSLDNNFPSRPEYDYRIQIYNGNEVKQEIYVFESKDNNSTWSRNNYSSNGRINDSVKTELLLYSKPLETKLYEFKNKEIANEFYAYAQSKNAFISIPHFRNWKKYDGELHFMADINEIPVKIDSLKEAIKSNYPDYEIKIQISDCYLSGCAYTSRVKLFSSEEFFIEFKYNEKMYPERIRPDSVKQSYIEHILKDYTVFGLRTPVIRNGKDFYKEINRKDNPKPKIIELSDLQISRFNKANYDFYIIYDPIIEVISDSATIRKLDEWIKKPMKNSQLTELE